MYKIAVQIQFYRVYNPQNGWYTDSEVHRCLALFNLHHEHRVRTALQQAFDKTSESSVHVLASYQGRTLVLGW